MKRRTQTILYHLLPPVFWLLAIGGTLLPVVWVTLPEGYWWGYLSAALTLICFFIISRIERHTRSVEQCFQVAVLLGIAAYWLPSIVFLIIPIWGYLYYMNIFEFRSILASLIGFACVAIWAVVGNYFSLFTFHFSLSYNLFAWIPTGAILLAWLGATIARQILRVR